jgi:hypothetical protein
MEMLGVVCVVRADVGVSVCLGSSPWMHTPRMRGMKVVVMSRRSSGVRPKAGCAVCMRKREAAHITSVPTHALMTRVSG